MVLNKYVCTWLSLFHVFLLIAKWTGGGVKHMSVPGFPGVMSSYFYCKVKTCFIFRKLTGGFDICAYLDFTLTCHVCLLVAKWKGVVITYVCTWLSLCHVFVTIATWKTGGFNIGLYLGFPSVMTYRKVRRGWLKHMSVPGFPCVMFCYLSQGKTWMILPAKMLLCRF